MHQGLRVLRFKLNGLIQIGNRFLSFSSAVIKGTTGNITYGILRSDLDGFAEKGDRFFRFASHLINLTPIDVSGGLVRIELKSFVQISHRLFEITLLGVEKSAPAISRGSLYDVFLERLGNVLQRPKILSRLLAPGSQAQKVSIISDRFVPV